MQKIINAHVTQASYFTYNITYNVKSDRYPNSYYNTGSIQHYGKWGNKTIINWRVRRFINKYNRKEEIEANRVINKWEITP